LSWNVDVIVASNLENALVQEDSVLLPVLSILGVLKTSEEDLVTDVDADTVLFVFLKFFLVIEVNENNSSVSMSFSSSFLVLEDLDAFLVLALSGCIDFFFDFLFESAKSVFQVSSLNVCSSKGAA
jgi:hypothetical protein